MIKIFLSTVFILGTLIGSYLVLTKNRTVPLPTLNIPQAFPSPTPFLFEEITIPHLKNRKYESQLGQLQKISENSNYASYLTTYTSDSLKVNGLLTQPKGETPPGG